MTGRTVHGSTTEMIQAVAAGRPVRREPAANPGPDADPAAAPETLVIGDERFRIERIGRSLDWVMRALGDGADGRPPWTVLLWQSGLLDRLPRTVDHTIAGVSWDPNTEIADLLVLDEPRSSVPWEIDLEVHRRLLDHMAALHARFWHFTDPVGLAPPGARYTALAPSTGIREAGAGADALVVGWAALAADQPEAHAVALGLAVAPAPLLAAFDGLPTTLVNGDWRVGNLRPLADGRTALLGWGWAGAAGSCVDLAGYLALNAGKLPESKDATIDAFRAALERHKIDTADWWDRQLELALLGAFVQLGWSKTTDPPELAWWIDRVLPTARTLPD